MKSSKKPTSSDIARETGYSKTTVSFAFNSPSRISQEARDKILEVAKRLEYTPDPMARNFSLGRHKSIGFLLPQLIMLLLMVLFRWAFGLILKLENP